MGTHDNLCHFSALTLGSVTLNFVSLTIGTIYWICSITNWKSSIFLWFLYFPLQNIIIKIVALVRKLKNLLRAGIISTSRHLVSVLQLHVQYSETPGVQVLTVTQKVGVHASVENELSLYLWNVRLRRYPWLWVNIYGFQSAVWWGGRGRRFLKSRFPLWNELERMGCQKSSLLPAAVCFPSFIKCAEFDD